LSDFISRMSRALDRQAPTWGITPVPEHLRGLSELDLGVLWGDLSVGLLVLAAGALLVPGLGLPQASLAILIGSAVGCLLLALVGVAGSREGVPGMVLFRPVLGLRGSWLPSVLNLVQLVGWTAIEMWAMGRVANTVSKTLFHLDADLFWLVIVAVFCTALALGGPVLVVRKWLERFGVYVMAAAGAWLTYRVIFAGDLSALWSRPGKGGWPTFVLAVDLVIAMPVSWLPLVADFNRFSKNGINSFAGTFWGFFAGNAWFLALGAMLVLAAGAAPDAAGIGASIATLAGGTLLLVILLVGETDEAFANIYSAAVSLQNLFPRAPQRLSIAGVGGTGLALAAFLSMGAYQYFLLLIGSVFVPLFGVFVADYFVLGDSGYSETDLFESRGRFWFRWGVKWAAIIPWVLGFVVYQWSVPTGPGWWTSTVERAATALHLPFPLLGAALGASLPSFLTAFGFALAFGIRGLQRGAPQRPEPPPARSTRS
jgi:putative hydroxymethylpyrimidine transporter CytX